MTLKLWARSSDDAVLHLPSEQPPAGPRASRRQVLAGSIAAAVGSFTNFGLLGTGANRKASPAADVAGALSNSTLVPVPEDLVEPVDAALRHFNDRGYPVVLNHVYRTDFKDDSGARRTAASWVESGPIRNNRQPIIFVYSADGHRFVHSLLVEWERHYDGPMSMGHLRHALSLEVGAYDIQQGTYCPVGTVTNGAGGPSVHIRPESGLDATHLQPVAELLSFDVDENPVKRPSAKAHPLCTSCQTVVATLPLSCGLFSYLICNAACAGLCLTTGPGCAACSVLCAVGVGVACDGIGCQYISCATCERAGLCGPYDACIDAC